MIVFNDGNYETGDWLTAETYPERTCYVVAEGSVLAKKIATLYPFYTLIILDGELIDVMPRTKTPEEIAAENARPPSPDVRIAELEQTVAALTQILAEKGITP